MAAQHAYAYTQLQPFMQAQAQLGESVTTVALRQLHKYVVLALSIAGFHSALRVFDRSHLAPCAEQASLVA